MELWTEAEVHNWLKTLPYVSKLNLDFFEFIDGATLTMLDIEQAKLLQVPTSLIPRLLKDLKTFELPSSPLSSIATPHSNVKTIYSGATPVPSFAPSISECVGTQQSLLVSNEGKSDLQKNTDKVSRVETQETKTKAINVNQIPGRIAVEDSRRTSQKKRRPVNVIPGKRGFQLGGGEFTVHYNKSQVETDPDGMFICPRSGCDKKFKHIGKLNRHQYIHTGEKRYACEFENCGRRFYRNSYLQRHYKSHMNQRNFKCNRDGCTSKAFLTKTKLRLHLKTHESDASANSLSCPIAGCGRVFRKTEKLRIHVCQHRGEKPFVCDHESCGEKFETKNRLTKHKLNYHAPGGYVCAVVDCAAHFASLTDLKKHCDKAHQGSYVCPDCGKLLRPSNIASHRRLHGSAQGPHETSLKQLHINTQRKGHLKSKAVKCDVKDYGKGFCRTKSRTQHVDSIHINRTSKEELEQTNEKNLRILIAGKGHQITPLPHSACTAASGVDLSMACENGTDNALVPIKRKRKIVAKRTKSKRLKKITPSSSSSSSTDSYPQRPDTSTQGLAVQAAVAAIRAAASVASASSSMCRSDKDTNTMHILETCNADAFSSLFTDPSPTVVPTVRSTLLAHSPYNSPSLAPLNLSGSFSLSNLISDPRGS